MSLPLEGIRVIDLSINSPGPLATMMLGDFGADVVQIVRPGFSSLGQAYAGDIADDPYIAARFQNYDAVMRNKRSLALDLKSEEGKKIMTTLLETADVFLEELRPGKLDKLGFGYANVSKLNPGIIYCSMSGYGQTGPLRETPGHDINYLAMSGALDMIRDTSEQPINPQNILSDNGGGSMSAVVGILLALIERGKNGKGQWVDACCTDSVVYLMADIFSVALGGNFHTSNWKETFLGRLPNYRAYRCADMKWISVGALESHFASALFDGLDRPELIKMLDNREQWPELSNILETLFESMPRDHWLNLFEDSDACVTAVLSPEDMVEDPQIQAREMIVEKDGITQIGIAPKLSNTPGEIRRRPAEPGEHCREILKEIGIGESEYLTLRKNRITD